MYGDTLQTFVTEKGTVIWPRKGQHKIFEALVDTADAEWDQKAYAALMAYVCPDHPQQWGALEDFGRSPFPVLTRKGGHQWEFFGDGEWKDFQIGQVVVEKPQKPNWAKGWGSREDFEDDFSENQKVGKTTLQFNQKTENGGMLIGREYTIFFHRDGTVRVGGYQDGSGDGPSTREQAPLAWEYLEAYGFEVVTESRPITRYEMERHVFYASVAAHKPTPKREKELLAWLYRQGWNQFEITPVAGVVEVPVTGVSHGGIGDHSDIKVALVEVFDPTCLKEWAGKSGRLHSSLGWGPACSLVGDKLPKRGGFTRVDRHNSPIDERWRLAGFGADRAEAERVRAMWHRVDQVAGTGAVLQVMNGVTMNLVGRC